MKSILTCLLAPFRFAWLILDGAAVFSPQWTTVKRLAGGVWVRTSYFWLFFVPVVAKALSNAGESVTLGFGKHVVEVPLSLPFSWKLFYFAAVAFAAARVIFNSFCPALIRDYATYSEFRDEGKGSDFILEEFLNYAFWNIQHGDTAHKECVKGQLKYFVSRYTTGDVKEFGESIERDLSTHREPTAEDREIGLERVKEGKVMRIIDEQFPDSFWYARNVTKETRKIPRALAAYLFMAGYAAYLFVAFQGFSYVWNLI
jgi:hypothetical protein